MSRTPAVPPSVLTVNAGSSSLRLASYRFDPQAHRTAALHLSPAPPRGAEILTGFFSRQSTSAPELVVHRVVHGGEALAAPCRIDAVVESEIERLKAFAPLHNGIALEWIRAARVAFGTQTAQVACFDTGFYAALPRVAATYALPRVLRERYGIRRYGFHGLAHQSMLNAWPERCGGAESARVISLQLGAGCSVTASAGGRPVETSMGFSPLEGLVMATRCGDLDPAAVLHLIDHGGFAPTELGQILNESSGLYALSGHSGDMRVLLDSDSEDAALAIDVFCHRACKYVGACLAVLGGADAILFGGGIGEGAPLIRARILERFGWAGIRVDAERNASAQPHQGGRIHADDSDVEVWVVPSDEGRVMAEAGWALLLASAPAETHSPAGVQR